MEPTTVAACDAALADLRLMLRVAYDRLDMGAARALGDTVNHVLDLRLALTRVKVGAAVIVVLRGGWRGLLALIDTIPRHCRHEPHAMTTPTCCGKCGRTLCPLCGRAVEAMQAHYSEKHADALADLNAALRYGKL